MIGHGDSASDAPADWGRIRIVYIAYPSDAIVFFEESMFYRRPEWMVPPRGEDVSPLLQWFPIITALQVGIDMIAGPTDSLILADGMSWSFFKRSLTGQINVDDVED